jgi:hypothetical protein
MTRSEAVKAEEIDLADPQPAFLLMILQSKSYRLGRSARGFRC